MHISWQKLCRPTKGIHVNICTSQYAKFKTADETGRDALNALKPIFWTKLLSIILYRSVPTNSTVQIDWYKSQFFKDFYVLERKQVSITAVVFSKNERFDVTISKPCIILTSTQRAGGTKKLTLVSRMPFSCQIYALCIRPILTIQYRHLALKLRYKDSCQVYVTYFYSFLDEIHEFVLPE